VRWGYHAAVELDAAGAAHLVASTAELPPLLTTLAAAGASGTR
jgi:phosphoglycolate phosphatase-like HAD superfamily hydrolase